MREQVAGSCAIDTKLSRQRRRVTSYMIILALVATNGQLQRIKATKLAHHVVLHVASVAATRALLRDRAVDVLLIDPMVGSTVPRVASSPAELFSLGVEFPYLPVVFYVSNPARALPLVAQFPTRERCEALVAGFEDDEQALARTIEWVVASSLAAKVLGRLGPSVFGLPPALGRTLRHAIADPRPFRTVEDLANTACMSRRTLDRWLARCGVVPGADVLHAARVFLALRQARDAHLRLDAAYIAGGGGRSPTSDPSHRRLVGIAEQRLIAASEAEISDWFVRRLATTSEIHTGRVQPAAKRRLLNEVSSEKCARCAVAW